MSEEGLIVEEAATGPMRRCVAARESRSASGMIRFVVGPDRALVPDLAGRLPGRGLWLSAERRAVQSAVAKNLFAKAARGQVVVERDLADRLESMLVRRCLDLVGLARRAGELVAGFDQVSDWLRQGKAALVLQARDGAADGRRKIAGQARDLPILELFDREELGHAIGRAEAVHLALAAGGVERRLRSESERLKGFRDLSLPGAGIATEREEGLSHT